MREKFHFHWQTGMGFIESFWNQFLLSQVIKWLTLDSQGGHWGFIKYWPPKKTRISTKYWPHITLLTKYWQQKFLKKCAFTPKKNKYWPNIDHTALYRPNIDRKSSLKSAHLHYLLLSPEIYSFWENEAFQEIWGINEDHFNWGHLGKHCIWTTLHYA